MTDISYSAKNWWSGCFIFLVNLRYFAVSHKDINDARTIGGTRRLRRRLDLSFLNPRNLTKEECDEEPNFLGQAFLYEAACSFMSTGKSDSYWTAACLNEDLFEDTPRLEFEEGLDIDGLLADNEFDPLTLEPFMQPTPSPRTYFLVFLTSIVTSIVGHQQVIECWISASLARHVSCPIFYPLFTERESTRNLYEYFSSSGDHTPDLPANRFVVPKS